MSLKIDLHPDGPGRARLVILGPGTVPETIALSLQRNDGSFLGPERQWQATIHWHPLFNAHPTPEGVEMALGPELIDGVISLGGAPVRALMRMDGSERAGILRMRGPLIGSGAAAEPRADGPRFANALQGVPEQSPDEDPAEGAEAPPSPVTEHAASPGSPGFKSGPPRAVRRRRLTLMIGALLGASTLMLGTAHFAGWLGDAWWPWKDRTDLIGTPAPPPPLAPLDSGKAAADQAGAEGEASGAGPGEVARDTAAAAETEAQPSPSGEREPGAAAPLESSQPVAADTGPMGGDRQPEQGIALARRFLASGPEPDAVFTQAEQLETAGDCPAAYALFSEAANADPGLAARLARRYDPLTHRASPCIEAPDIPYAIVYYSDAAEAGDIEVQRRLGQLMAERERSGPTHEAGIDWLRRAASAGDTEAARLLQAMTEQADAL